MPRIAYVILCSCLVVGAGLVAIPAGAHEDNDSYSEVVNRPHRQPVWYSSVCCYMKIVRHVGDRRQVRYVRVRGPRYRPDDRDRPRKPVNHRPRRATKATKYEVYVVRRDRDRRRVRCHRRRVRVLGANGGTVWALTARCY